ncbi:hypothetical protein ACIQTW_08220 [Paenarthrobacter sp. NPDC090517]|uniref:hypothetical protein n=1 Tax=Paenarthrobacter sp. NPDC090517 TaxID=3364381 RepID=UPI00380B22BF
MAAMPPTMNRYPWGTCLDKLLEMPLSDWFSFIPGIIAIWALRAAWRANPERLMKRARIRTMQRLGISPRDSKLRVKSIAENGPASAADELNWLATVYRGNAVSPAMTCGTGNPMPLTFSTSTVALGGLSKAYSLYAAELRKGSFLGTASAPLITKEAQTAIDTSAALASAASGGGAEVSCRCWAVHLKLPDERTFDLWQLPDFESGTLAYDLFVSYRRHRLAPDFHEPGARVSPVAIEAEDLETELLPTTAVESGILRDKFQNLRTFDSVLPRLIDWRAERDNGNGRMRLHLAMAETTYAAVLTDHYPATFRKPGEAAGMQSRVAAGENAKLLTLSTVVITGDNKMLFAGRSKHAGSHAELFGPAVNGNLELRPRDGILADSDHRGIPDPRRALAREAREELGLHLDPEHIRALGLAKFTVDKERGTHVLLSVSNVAQTAKEVAEGVRFADPLEGRWEVGSEMLAVPLPLPDSDIDGLLSWFLHSPILTPHAALAGISTVASHIRVTAEQLNRLASSGPTGRGPDPSERIPLQR